MQILNQSRIMVFPYAKWYIILGGILISIIIVFFGAYLMEETDHSIIGLATIAISIVLFFSSLLIPAIVSKPSDRYAYCVIFDRDHSFEEYKDQYDLVSIDGLLYTIQDKEKS